MCSHNYNFPPDMRESLEHIHHNFMQLNLAHLANDGPIVHEQNGP